MKRTVMTILAACSIFAAVAQTKEITILAVNDIHAAIDQFPKFAAIVDSVRSVHPDALLFSAGDNRTGNPFNDKHTTPNLPIVTLMNRLRFNLSAVGNHEFDGKAEGLRYTINESDFPYVCANMYPDDTLRLRVYPYRMLEVEGVKIGVLGLLQVGNAGISDALPANLKGIAFREPAVVAREYEWLRKQCDVMILLSHVGFEGDVQLAKDFPEVDAIIGGHSHTAVKGTKLFGKVLITQAENSLKYVTEIKLRVENGKVTSKDAHLIDVKTFAKSDSSVQAMVDEYSQNKALEQVLTEVNEFDNKEELGCLMADAILKGAGADIAVQNAGGVRFETHQKGDFTLKDVYRLDPFGNELVVYNLTGEEVVRMLSAAIDKYGPAFVSGITYEITLGKNPFDVKKLVVKNPDGSKFDLKRTYKVAMNSYLASVCSYEKQDQGQSLFVPCSDKMIEFLKSKPYFDYKGVKRVIINK